MMSCEEISCELRKKRPTNKKAKKIDKANVNAIEIVMTTTWHHEKHIYSTIPPMD